MSRSDDRPADRAYRSPADACLARTADAIDFASPSTEETAAADRRIAPIRRILADMFRGIGRRRT